MLLNWSETAAHDVLNYHAREQEVLQIFLSAGFRAAAGHLESAERMPFHNGTSDCAIEVKIADHQFVLGSGQCLGTAGKNTTGQCVVGAVDEGKGFVEIFGSENGDNGSKYFLPGNRIRWLHIGEHGWCCVVSIGWGGTLPGQAGFLFPLFNHRMDFCLCIQIYNRPNNGAGHSWIADWNGRTGRDKSFHELVVNIIQHDQSR